MKKILLTLFFCLFSLNAYAQDFGDFAPNKATRIKVINFDSYFDVASPPTVQNSLEQISASYPIVTSGLTVYGDLLPDNDNTRDIGSVDLTWNEIFGRTYMASDVIVNNTASAPIVDTQYLENSRDGAVSFRDDIIFPLTGSSIGTTNYGWLFDETNGDITTTANIGIGTTTPGQILEVNADANYVRYNFPTNTSYGGYTITENGGLKGFMQVVGSNFATATRRNDLELSSIDGDLTLQWLSGGYVGIGTDAPQTQLHLRRSTPVLRLDDSQAANDNDKHTYIEFGGEATWDRTGFIGDASAADDDIWVYGEDDGAMIAGANGTGLRVDNVGNVGIGTTTPTMPLDTVGTGLLRLGTFYTTLRGLQDKTTYRGVALGYDTSGQIGAILSDTGGNASELSFWTYTGAAYNEQVRIDSTGNVGIGTINPSELLHVNNTAGNSRIEISSDTDNAVLILNAPADEQSNIYFEAGGSWKTALYRDANSDDLRIVSSDGGVGDIIIFEQSTGNVGIGTTPSYLLDVAGNSRLQECVIFGSEEGAPCVDGDIFSTTYGRLYITPSAGNRAMSSFYYPSGTNDEAVIQINNSSDISNRGRLNCWIHGVYAKVVTDKVGAGGTAPQYLIFGEESTANSLSDIYFRFNGTDSVTIQDPGDVGIGILNPTEALTIGNAGKLQINSAGDDKYVQMYHDDVDANIVVSSGELNLSATVFDFDSNSNSQNIYIRGLDAGTEWANLFVNANDDFNIFVNGGKTILDSNSDSECLRLVGADSANDYADIYVDADSILRIAPNAGGVVFQHKIVQSGANATAVGPTDNFDVSGVNLVYVNTNANNVTIGGFVGGYDGQVIHVFVVDASNNAILEHNEGTANQNIFLNSGADETLTASYGGWTLVCDGVAWFEVDN